MARCAFYVVGDAKFFVGVAALVNSLRLVGHDEPILVMDCGLEERQRELLAGEATLLPAPAAARPNFVKWIAPLEHPAEVIVLIDADMVVLRSLAPVVALAATGKIVAFVDLNPDRFDEAWAAMLGVESLPRRTYVNGGFAALPQAGGTELLERLQEIHPRLPLDFVHRDSGSRPFKYRDQDVLNVVLAAYAAEEDVVVLERRLAPCQPFRGLRLVDARTLDCRYPDGERPYLLHHINEKPWLTPTAPSPYSRLLPRLLLADDVPIRLTPEDLPFQLRPGPLPGAARKALLLRWLATKLRFKARVTLAEARGRLSGGQQRA